MKRLFTYSLIYFCSIFTILILLIVIFKPIRILAGAILNRCYFYSQVGQTTLQIPNKEIPLKIFKAKNKPFLLVGPANYESYNDFFFVSDKYVIVTATDKGSEWFLCGKILMLNDDMTTPKERLRSAYGDCFVGKEKIILENGEEAYLFKMKWYDTAKDTLTFSIPKKYFTDDMPDANDFVFMKNSPY